MNITPENIIDDYIIGSGATWWEWWRGVTPKSHNRLHIVVENPWEEGDLTYTINGHCLWWAYLDLMGFTPGRHRAPAFEGVHIDDPDLDGSLTDIIIQHAIFGDIIYG